MVKTLKEYLSTVTIGGLGLIKPMAALSRKGTDLGPKNGRARGVGTLVAQKEPVAERKQKPYVSSVNGVYSVLDGDGKEVFKTRDKTLAHGWFKKNYDKIKETKKRK